MSLFIRKECQKLLDGVGLAHYHIQIDEDTKCLKIVGECGQSLVSIAGIRLSRMAPAKEEIALALELFDAFLAKHTATLKDFTIAKALADKEHVPLEIRRLQNSEITKQNYQDYWTLTFNMFHHSDAKVVVLSTGKCTIPSNTVYLAEQEAEDLQITLTNEELKLVTAWVKACVKYTEAITRKNDAIALLNSCEI